MGTTLLLIPAVSVNEDEVLVVEWRKSHCQYVRKGEVVCVVETSKTSIEIEAEEDGYLFQVGKKGERLKTGEVLGALTDKETNEIEIPPRRTDSTPEPRWTKKAELLAKRMGIDLEEMAKGMPGRLIGESDILAKGNSSAHSWTERILILGGGSAAIQILDLLGRAKGQQPVGILDDDPGLHGQSVMGVKVLGGIEHAMQCWKDRICDAMVIAIGLDLDKRAKLFLDLRKNGVRFTNVLDPNVDIHRDVTIGTGNIFMSFSYIGPCAKIGDNNFFSSFTCLEHHNQIGSHCLFGPRVATSGYVTIGDKVKFGTQIAIEPQVNVGDGAVIASGSVLTADVKPRSIVKARLRI